MSFIFYKKKWKSAIREKNKWMEMPGWSGHAMSLTLDKNHFHKIVLYCFLFTESLLESLLSTIVRVDERKLRCCWNIYFWDISLFSLFFFFFHVITVFLFYENIHNRFLWKSNARIWGHDCAMAIFSLQEEICLQRKHCHSSILSSNSSIASIASIALTY